MELINRQKCLARRREPLDLDFARDARNFAAVGRVEDEHILCSRNHGELGSAGQSEHSPFTFGKADAETMPADDCVVGPYLSLASAQERLAVSREDNRA